MLLHRGCSLGSVVKFFSAPIFQSRSERLPLNAVAFAVEFRGINL